VIYGGRTPKGKQTKKRGHVQHQNSVRGSRGRKRVGPEKGKACYLTELMSSRAVEGRKGKEEATAGWGLGEKLHEFGVSSGSKKRCQEDERAGDPNKISSPTQTNKPKSTASGPTKGRTDGKLS